jgi:hypothetical protein
LLKKRHLNKINQKMEDEHFFLSLSAKQAKLGSGFGLIADLFLFGTFWTLL